MLGFWICGFALQLGGVGASRPWAAATGSNASSSITLFGKDFGLFGTKGFFLTGVAYDVVVFSVFLFQMVFMDTTATIPTGAMAERWKFKSFMIYAFFVSMFLYPLFATGSGAAAGCRRWAKLRPGHGVVTSRVPRLFT